MSEVCADRAVEVPLSLNVIDRSYGQSQMSIEDGNSAGRILGSEPVIARMQPTCTACLTYGSRNQCPRSAFIVCFRPQQGEGHAKI